MVKESETVLQKYRGSILMRLLSRHVETLLLLFMLLLLLLVICGLSTLINRDFRCSKITKDQRADRRTDKTSYSDAQSHLKRREGKKGMKKVSLKVFSFFIEID